MKALANNIDGELSGSKESFILVIDNQDSFVYNLVHYLRELGVAVIVHRHDKLTVEAIAEMKPSGVLISPGPKRPADVAVCVEAVRVLGGKIPILGVCLGHQVIAEAYGGVVVEGSSPIHGKNSEIYHDSNGVFDGLPCPYTATRYHSLVVEEESLPDCLEVSARAEDGTIMGIRHRSFPVEGVQFHPEAVLTEHGHALLANFLRLSGIAFVKQVEPRSSQGEGNGSSHSFSLDCSGALSKKSAENYLNCNIGAVGTRLHHSRRYIENVSPESLAEQVFAKVRAQEGSVFLDSAKRIAEMGETSVVGWSPWLALWQFRGKVYSLRLPLSAKFQEEGSVSSEVINGILLQTRLQADIASHDGDILDVLKKIMKTISYTGADCAGFHGGAIGMLGYECLESLGNAPLSEAIDTPEAFFWFHRHLLQLDHIKNTVSLILACPDTEHAAALENSALRLLADVVQENEAVKAKSGVRNNADAEESPLYKSLIKDNSQKDLRSPNAQDQDQDQDQANDLQNGWQSRFSTNIENGQYCLDVEAMRQYIKRGDIYIANMTRQFRTATEAHGYRLHEKLRKQNPAAFSAYFPFGGFELISASPERFLRIENRWVETRPIKGTRPRGATREEDELNKKELEHSEKDKSELLMITDLERNDLSKVCIPGTVKVTELFHLETLPTVFHLVSTVRGRLEADKDAVDCIRACFPGGSISGAPKGRAIEVIRELEGLPRGPYTGCLGWIGYNGDANFSILIRTIVKHKNSVTFGVGGGITWESVPEAEVAETLDKAKALMRVLS